MLLVRFSNAIWLLENFFFFVFTCHLLIVLSSFFLLLHCWIISFSSEQSNELTCLMYNVNMQKSFFYIYYIRNELTGCCALFLWNWFPFNQVSLLSSSRTLFNHANTKTIPNRSVSIYTNIEMRVFRSLPAKEHLFPLFVYRWRLNDQYVCMYVHDILMMSCLICLFDWLLADE